MGGLLRGLLVGFARIHGSMVEENIIIWRNFSPVDRHGANSGGNVEGVHSADGGIALGSVVAVTLMPRPRGHVHTAGVSSGLHGVVVGPGA